MILARSIYLCFFIDAHTMEVDFVSKLVCNERSKSDFSAKQLFVKVSEYNTPTRQTTSNAIKIKLPPFLHKSRLNAKSVPTAVLEPYKCSKSIYLSSHFLRTEMFSIFTVIKEIQVNEEVYEPIFVYGV